MNSREMIALIKESKISAGALLQAGHEMLGNRLANAVAACENANTPPEQKQFGTLTVEHVMKVVDISIYSVKNTLLMSLSELVTYMDTDSNEEIYDLETVKEAFDNNQLLISFEDAAALMDVQLACKHHEAGYFRFINS